MYDTIPTINKPDYPVERKESAKSIMENMDEILNELENHLSSIEAAVFGPELRENDGREPQDDCMLSLLNRQRNKAERLLKIAVHIREGLW